MAESTIFDDVFRTETEKMPELTIPLINEVFGTNYPSNVEIIQGRNEHLAKSGKKITDSYIIIGEKRYHMECQSTEDSTMILQSVWNMQKKFMVCTGCSFHIPVYYICVEMLRKRM